MLLEEICGFPLITVKKTAIAFSQEHTREKDVQECKLHVVDASVMIGFCIILIWNTKHM